MLEVRLLAAGRMPIRRAALPDVLGILPFTQGSDNGHFAQKKRESSKHILQIGHVLQCVIPVRMKTKTLLLVVAAA